MIVHLTNGTTHFRQVPCNVKPRNTLVCLKASEDHHYNDAYFFSVREAPCIAPLFSFWFRRGECGSSLIGCEIWPAFILRHAPGPNASQVIWSTRYVNHCHICREANEVDGMWHYDKYFHGLRQDALSQHSLLFLPACIPTSADRHPTVSDIFHPPLWQFFLFLGLYHPPITFFTSVLCFLYRLARYLFNPRIQCRWTQWESKSSWLCYDGPSRT